MAEQGGFERDFARVEAYMRDWSLEEATRVLEAMKRAQGFPNRVRHDLSVLYAQQGMFAEALAEIEAALALEPGNRALWHHFLALQKNNPRQPTPAEWRAMHLGYGDTLREAIDVRHLEVARTAAPGRRLRVGYLCLDTHIATERFVWPVLEHFDPAGFEVHAYWCHTPVTPALSAAYPRVAHRSLVGMDDEQVVAMILADAIDILVDIAGHGAGNRLPVLAKRPAPLVATWLDYLATTGLDAVDYRITDGVADPLGAEAAHVERLIRLPSAQWCYRPPAVEVDLDAPRPADPVTFGSVSVPLKLSDTVLDLWARVLAGLPASRLRLLGVPEGRARARILRRLGSGGVDASRIEIHARLDQAQFLREIARIDVVLDTHPFSGATSTLDALWQGVPVVTLAGTLSHSRSTASILHALGRREWVASSADEYVRIATGVAARAREAAQRAQLREDLRASALCEGPAFARAMEAAYRQGWDEVAGRAESRPRDVMAQFWRDLRQGKPMPGERVALDRVADVIDLSKGGPHELSAGAREWVLLTDSALFRADVAAASIPAALLERYDVLAPLGVAELACAEPAAAGEGRVRGVSLVDDAQVGKLFANAFVPRGSWECVALSGGAVLVRKARLARLDMAPRGGAHPIEFRCEVLRLSRRLHAAGARLGVSVALAPADRTWGLEGAVRHASLRAVEAELGLARWGQRQPSARPMKAAVSAELWAALRPALETACDSPI